MSQQTNENAICPTCGYKLDAATAAFDDDTVKPRENDLSICINCGEILKFNSSLMLQLLNKEEMIDLKNNHPVSYNQLQRAKDAWRKVKK